MRRLSAALVTVALSAASGTASAEFAASVTEFNQGTVAFANPAVAYNTASTAVGAPTRIAGESGAWPGPVTPFNPPYTQGEVVSVGVGGRLTLQLGAAVPVGSGTRVGIFTTAGLNDPNYSGVAESPARTFAGVEYGADRSAVVEVAGTSGNFVSLGRVLFTNPTQGYANQTTPYDFPRNGVFSNPNLPFAGDLSSFNGLASEQISTLLNGSAGGTWIDVPAATGLTEVRYVRISDPMWVTLENGSLVTSRPSAYTEPGAPVFNKPADLFVDAVNVVPEPTALSLVVLGALLITGHRRRR